MQRKDDELGDYLERSILLSADGEWPSIAQLSDDLLVSRRTAERRARELRWLDGHACLGKYYQHSVFVSGDEKRNMTQQLCVHVRFIGPGGSEWTPEPFDLCEQRNTRNRESYARWLQERGMGNPVPDVAA